MEPLRFITLNPGHFHAALVHKQMYDGVDARTHVYAPLGPNLLAHLERLGQFNTRAGDPTRWEVEAHAGGDCLHRLVRERPGHIVVLAGHNSSKIQAIEAAVGAGLHVLADKPWILRPEQLPRLQEALETAEREGLIAYDIMTERFEITSILQRELVQDVAVFGEPVAGSVEEPCVYMESVHFLKKTVAGAPLRRPAVFFDVEQQGEGLNDVGTHLVDLIPWILFPGQAITDPDLALQSARRWPTRLTREDFQAITGEAEFPAWLASHVNGGGLDYFCNTQVAYRLRGLWVKLDVLWGLEAKQGAGDTHLAVFRGSRARVEVRQGEAEKYRPELYVVSEEGAVDEVARAVTARLGKLQALYPGLNLEREEGRLHVVIPQTLRTGHEAHFAEVTRQFLRYVRGTEKLPTWEKPNMLAKYRITTEGVALAGQDSDAR